VKTVSRTLQLVIAVLVIVVGLGVASVRVMFPNADRYRDDLEGWLAGVAGQPVAIGSLEAEWHGWGPEFRITDLKLREPTQRGKDGGVNAHFESATVSVDVLASLLGGKLRPRHIRMGDVSLRVTQAAGARAPDAGPDAELEQHGLALLDWLLAQYRLGLDATRVEFADIRVAGEPLTLTNVHLMVRNEGAAHAIEASVDVPGAQNGAVSARARISGDPGSSDWSGDIAIDVAGLNVACLEAWPYPLGSDALAGRLTLRLDSRWSKGALVEAEGGVSVRDMRVASAAGTLGPLSGEALVDVSRRTDGWRLQLQRARGGFLSFRDPTPIATLHYAGTPSKPEARLSAAIPELDIAALVPLLPIALDASDEVWRQAMQAQPSGRIRDLAVSVESDADGEWDIAVAGELHDAGNRSSGPLPALSGVDGAFDHDATGTRVRFADGRIHASLADFFPEPLTGEKLRGELLLSGNDSERRLVLSDLGFVTPDVTLRATGELLWQGDDPVPFVDLALGFTDGDLERLEYFVPTSIFGPKVDAWLTRGFPRGELTAGTVQMRGRPPRRLRRDSDFSVTVHASVRDTTVDYWDGWPRAERVAGNVHIADWRIVSDVSEGYFFGARIRPSQWTIPDIFAAKPAFEWRTRIDGTTGDAIRYLRESPLRNRLRALVDNVEAGGDASLTLDLAVPLKGGGRPRVSGNLEIAGNTLAVPSFDEGFTDIAGRIAFDQDGMRAEDLTSTYLGRTVTASIESAAEGGGHTRARIAGTADAAYLARHLHNAGLLASADLDAMPILARLDGETAWEATVDVLDKADDGRTPVVLRVDSNLEGATLAFPAPFTKDADATLPVTVEARFADAAHREMHLSLGQWASGIFDLSAGDDGYRLQRGAVHLGGGPATLPDVRRLSVTGHLPRGDLGEWSALVSNTLKGARGDDALPTRVDLSVDRLAMLGAEFADVRIAAYDEPDGGWRASVTGTDLDGEVRVPADRQQPIVANFDRLAWTPVPGDDAEPPDPRDLPPVRFTCRQCAYEDIPFRDVELVSSKTEDGLRIESLRLSNEGFQARANGDWTYDPQRGQRTRLDVQLSSEDLGKLLASLGHKGGATRGGVTDVSLAASWDGPPSEFDLEHLDGVMHFRAGEGTLTDVGRGTAGRLFGLLVVPDLPRRLKGDFSDLFEDGFVYKQIEGTFNIERGNAYTNDLTLDGSMARINIAGRTGLVAEDYDQLITVTPKLSDSLPLMPIWLLEKTFRKEVFDKLFAYQYTITGSWDEPSVTRVKIEHDLSSDRS
jgi:uncharacterized protein (TIGR02099 family)